MQRLKRLLILLLLIGSSVNAAEQLSNGFTQHRDSFFRAGFWWDPTDPGWGLDLHMSGGVMIGTWATYDADGHPSWYIGVGEPDGEDWVLPMESYRWQNGAASGARSEGTIRLTFADGFDARMRWQLNDRSGEHAIEPFIVDNRPIAEDRTGFWYNTAQPGYGMSVVTQDDLVMAVFYFYDHQGLPRWVWADNLADSESDSLRVLSFSGHCPGCQGEAGQGVAAGELSVQFQSENHAILRTNIQVVNNAMDYGWRIGQRVINLLSNRASGREQAFALVPFTNEQTLEAYLETGLVEPGPVAYSSSDISFSPAPAAEAPAVSGTNLQEQGVDELDLIKTDGQVIYSVDEGAEQIARIKIHRIDRDGDRLELLTTLDIEDPERRRIEGIYLVNQRAEGQPDLLLALLGASVYYAFDAWFAPWPWVDAESRILAWDVSDPDSPIAVADIHIDGSAIETRRIGESLYLVSRYQPHNELLASAGNLESASSLMAQVVLADLLPQVTVNGRASPLVTAQATYLPPQLPGYRYTDLISVSAFDLEDLDAFPRTVTFTGLAESAYVSRNNVFISSSRYASSIDPEFDALNWSGEMYTDVHQIALADGDPQYVGSGAVPGFIPWGGTSPTFAFSEHDGYLRVVSTTGDAWAGGSHRVSVLSLAGGEDRNLNVVGTVPNADRQTPLGKPGELLYGLRFLGDRLYAITFKSIDPLYVVDLQAPGDPKILGELEVSGFSDYLHPLPNGLLLGFGKEAVPVDDWGDGNFAWYQGLQLSLFDVRDPTQPTLVRRIEMGRRGSESALLHDHHAFAYLPPSSDGSRPARVSIPVVIHDVNRPSEVSSDPSHHYPWRYSGLAMFDLTGMGSGNTDLVFRDVMVTHTAEQSPQRNAYADATGRAARSIIDVQSAYFLLRGELYLGPWGNGPAMAGPF